MSAAVCCFSAPFPLWAVEGNFIFCLELQQEKGENLCAAPPGHPAPIFCYFIIIIFNLIISLNWCNHNQEATKRYMQDIISEYCSVLAFTARF